MAWCGPVSLTPTSTLSCHGFEVVERNWHLRSLKGACCIPGNVVFALFLLFQEFLATFPISSILLLVCFSISLWQYLTCFLFAARSRLVTFVRTRLYLTKAERFNHNPLLILHLDILYYETDAINYVRPAGVPCSTVNVRVCKFVTHGTRVALPNASNFYHRAGSAGIHGPCI